MTIAIGSDHRGFVLKAKIITLLKKKGMRVIDHGTDGPESVDYPAYAIKVAESVRKRRAQSGILICHSGQGMAMAANKTRGIRAAIAWQPAIAGLARRHNDANILVLPAGFIRSAERAKEIVRAFLTEPFEGGRHRRRLNIIKDYERNL